MVAKTNVLIPWYPISYLTIASSGFLFLGAYGSLPDAAIWWCLRTGGGGILTRVVRVLRVDTITITPPHSNMAQPNESGQ
jgi:hypothetical protein